MNKALVFSVIFPANLLYLPSFLDSLALQQATNFDVLLITDTVPDIDDHLKPYRLQLSIRTHALTGNIASIRKQGLNYAASLPYDYYILADTDDRLAPDRVAVAYHYLQTYPIVINDLAPFVEHTDHTLQGFWRDRISHEHIIYQQSIQEYNLAGLGNSSLRKEVIQTPVYWLSNKALDWSLFYQWLQHYPGIFVHTGLVQYRQHHQNTAGIQLLTEERILYILNTKLEHYASLLPWFPVLTDCWKKNNDIRLYLEGEKSRLTTIVNNLNQNSIHYFWWEETNYII